MDKLKHNKIYEDIIKYRIKNKTLFFILKIISYKNYIIYMAKDISNEKKYKQILEEKKT
jgi:hypothetical protein